MIDARHHGPHPLTAYRIREGLDISKDGHAHVFGGGGTGFGRVRRRIPQTIVHPFLRNLAMMLGASIPLTDALRATIAQLSHPRFRAVADHVLASVTAGKSLADGFAAHGAIFPSLLVQMSRIGEAAGILGIMLLRAVAQLERATMLQRTIRQALTYPTLVAGVAIAATAFLLTAVVPTFADMFDSFNAPLPAPTQALLAISGMVRNHAFAIALSLGPLLPAIAVLRRSVSGRRRLDRLLLTLPVVGSLLRLKEWAHFTSTLGTLLQHRIPLSDALQLLGQGSRNSVMQAAYAALLDGVRHGHALAVAMRQQGMFPDLIVQIVDTGEQTATLDTLLHHAADHYERELALRVSTLTTVLEPVLIVFLGIAMGAILVALYLPLFDLVTIVQ